MPEHMARHYSIAKRHMTQLADLVWPRRSILSGIMGEGVVTPEEFARLNFLTGTRCERCGSPEEIDLGPDTICAACTARPPRWRQARAALEYDQTIRPAILGLKRAGRRDGLSVMANWMIAAGRPLLDEADLLVPTPLHYSRLIRRGFNQAGWLASAIGRHTGLPVAPSAMKRMRPTPSQGGLSARQRRRNVAGAFTVRPGQKDRVRGQRIVLVDDVLTTGATASACTRALLTAGAANVDVLVLARVVAAQNITI